MKKWYFKYAIKTPYFFFFVILLGITLILVLLLTTGVPVVTTYSVRLDKNQDACFLLSEEPVFDSEIKTIFAYVDKNEEVHQLLNYKIVTGKQILISHKDWPDLHTEDNSSDFYIDISKYEVTLFEKIFVQGGKNE